jgi:type IV secretion system protein TrbL
MTGTGIIDQFLETFTRYIDNGFGLLGGDVGYLATTLAAIDITLAALFWSWGTDEDIIARPARRRRGPKRPIQSRGRSDLLHASQS